MYVIEYLRFPIYVGDEMRQLITEGKIVWGGRHFNSKRHASLSSAALSSSLLQAHHISILSSSVKYPHPLTILMSPKNQGFFYGGLLLPVLIGEVVLLKSKRDRFWTNGQFTPISAYFLTIPQFLHIDK